MEKNSFFLCEVCGNEVAVEAVRCPFCGYIRVATKYKRKIPGFRIINLEKGMPPVPDALQRMHNEIRVAHLQDERLLIFIHGYGSSGRGGAIRGEVRRQLQYRLDKKEINDFLPGENCYRRSGHFRQLVRRFPVLEKLVKRPNPGITIVIL
ncbi:MAG: hypothetical protein SCH71_07875 [Desulfobulbaceae bacterium]|nr:hypothetical protein [Desulfobulbaceae bacterium]